MKYDVRLGIYAPTGEYEKGQLANAAGIIGPLNRRCHLAG